MTNEVDRLVDRDKINLLLAIADAKSFSGAATVLGISQPAISKQVRQIEKLVDRPLFHRTRVGVELTGEGEAVIIYARAMLALTDDLRRHLEQTAGVAKVSIGMSEDFCRTALFAVLSLFMRDHAQVQVRMISGTYETLSAAIAAKAVDLAVTRRYARHPEAKLLWADKLVWRGRTDLLLPVKDPVPLVLPTAPSPGRDVAINALRECGRAWQIRFESVSLAGAEAALQAGLGICPGPHAMHLYGVNSFGNGSGLPDLPDVEFVMVGPERGAPDAVLAFAEVLRHASISSFQRPDRTPV